MDPRELGLDELSPLESCEPSPEIGIIGEAVNSLPDATISARPEIPWRQIAAMRNFLIHEYFNIDEAVVEDVIANDLEPLSVAVNALLEIPGAG